MKIYFVCVGLALSSAGLTQAAAEPIAKSVFYVPSIWLAGHQKAVQSVNFSPDGEKVVTASLDPKIDIGFRIPLKGPDQS